MKTSGKKRQIRARLKNSNEELAYLWQAICDETPRHNWELSIHAALENKNKTFGPPECYRCNVPLIALRTTPTSSAEERPSLGYLPRLIIIFNHLKFSQKGFFDEIREKAPILRWNDVSEKTRMLRLSNRNLSQTKSRLEREFEEAVTEIVNENLRAPLQLTELKIEALFSEDFCGPNAISDFHDFLTQRDKRRIYGRFFFGPRPEFFMSESSDRADNLKTLVEAVTKPSLDHPPSPLFINVYSPGMWQGLTACARSLIDRVEQNPDSPDILYLPIARQRQSDGAAPTDRTFETLTITQVVAYIRDFFRGCDLSQTQPISDKDRLFDAIQEIRVLMALNPAILIIDGFSEYGKSHSMLERIVLDHHLISLLNRLLEPAICSTSTPMSLDRFRQNKIVVLSNQKITRVGASHSRASDSSKNHIYIPPPDKDDFEDVLQSQPLYDRETVNELRKRVPTVASSCSEVLLYAIDGIVSVEKNILGSHWSRARLDSLGKTLSTKINNPDPKEALQQAITHLLRRLKEERPEWYAVLKIIATTPGGLRKQTLKRIIDASSRAYVRMPHLEHRTPFPGLETFSTIKDKHKLLDDILSVCRPFLALGRNDAFDGFDELPHPFEHSLADAINGFANESPETHSIDFTIPEIREAIRKQIAATRKHNAFHCMHRLLMEEALTQQTISLRHSDHSSSQSIRPMRRMLSAFYHGIQSIPISRNGQIEDVRFESPDFQAPTSAKEMWRWLYLFCYRRICEQPPLWNLSRYHGLDELKIELLEFFDKPWRLWREEMRPTMPTDPLAKGLFVSEYENTEQKQVAADFYISLSQAYFLVGTLDKARRSLTLSEEFLGNEKAKSLRIAKKQADIHLLCNELTEAAEIDVPLADALGPIHDSVHKRVDTIAHDLHQILINETNFNPDLRIPGYSVLLDDLVGYADQHKWESKLLSDISDSLFRIAEMYALEADITISRERLAYLSDYHHDGKASPDEKTSSEAEQKFCTSLAWYKCAEAVRLRNFIRNPLGNHFFASGHSARQMIRVALKLERIARQKRNTRKAPYSHAGYFAKAARKTADILTRHLYRFPRDRASMLILEATFIRLNSLESKQQQNLLIAREFLGRAEPIVLGLGTKARNRMRLCLERTKLNRAIALNLKNDGNSEYETYMQLCEFDVDLLNSLASDHKAPLWNELAELQRRKANEAREKLDE